jgi:hypothetical protein
MSDNPGNPAPGNPSNPNDPGASKPGDSGFITGEVRHQQLSARVPEDVAKGVFSTGVIVLSTQTEFVFDFLLRMSRPHQVTARVVIPPAVIPSVINVLRDNIHKYTDRYGPVPPAPKFESDRKPTLQEVYDDLKMPDDVLSGVYANAMMVGHSHAEFCFDFLTNFFPRSAVSCRVYLSASHVPRLLESLTQTFADYQRRYVLPRQQSPQQPLPPLGGVTGSQGLPGGNEIPPPGPQTPPSAEQEPPRA